jgi:hypothetical protein
MYHLVPVLAPKYKQHGLSPAEVRFISVSRNTPTNKKWNGIVVAAHILFALLYWRKELLHFGLHIHLQGQYYIPFPFPRCEKLVFASDLNFAEVYVNFEKYVIL